MKSSQDTFSQKRLLPFNPSNCDNIWYAHCRQQYAWIVIVVVSISIFFRQNTRFFALHDFDIEPKFSKIVPKFSVGQDLLYFYPSDLDKIWYTPNSFTFFVFYFIFDIFFSPKHSVFALSHSNTHGCSSSFPNLFFLKTRFSPSVTWKNSASYFYIPHFQLSTLYCSSIHPIWI